jgi:site-specific recombinase XerD
MSTDIVPAQQPTALHTPQQADSDATLIRLWLHGRSPRTQRAYAGDIQRFQARVEKPLQAVTLGDLQAFADSLIGLAPASQARALSAIKSLFTFGYKTGYLVLNVGAALRLPKQKHKLAERILSEAAIQRMLAMETNPRNHAMLRLTYGAGLRVAEVCALYWRDTLERGEAGQIVVFGKGGKTRVVLLSADTWHELQALRGSASLDDPVFRSKRGGPLDTSQALRIVKATAKRAGLPPEVSPHWLRHAHASHALDRGAPISLVQATLGHASVATTGRYLHARPEDSSSYYVPV